MKTMGLGVVLMLLCSCHQTTSRSIAGRAPSELQELMAAYLKEKDQWYGSFSQYEFRGPLTIEQIEQERTPPWINVTEIKRRTDVPHLPFGFGYDRWVEFKQEYGPGDELYFFTTQKRSWEYLMGSEGYLLLRKDKIVRTILARIN